MQCKREPNRKGRQRRITHSTRVRVRAFASPPPPGGMHTVPIGTCQSPRQKQRRNAHSTGSTCQSPFQKESMVCTEKDRNCSTMERQETKEPTTAGLSSSMGDMASVLLKLLLSENPAGSSREAASMCNAKGSQTQGSAKTKEECTQYRQHVSEPPFKENHGLPRERHDQEPTASWALHLQAASPASVLQNPSPGQARQSGKWEATHQCKHGANSKLNSANSGEGKQMASVLNNPSP